MKFITILALFLTGAIAQADQMEVYEAPQVEVYKEIPGYKAQAYEVYEQDRYGNQRPYPQGYAQEQRGYMPPFNPPYQGQCLIKQNPHSYACHDLNFYGNNRFPLFPMDWRRLQGPWFAVTYANPNGNIGHEFRMDVNPNRPTQPRGGVINRNDGSQMGVLELRPNHVAFHNWEWGGAYVESDPRTFRITDRYTVEFQWLFNGVWHGFQCRDFNRNNEHHLNCQWSVWTPQGGWHLKGYLGFIKLHVWEQFANGGGHHGGGQPPQDYFPPAPMPPGLY